MWRGLLLASTAAAALFAAASLTPNTPGVSLPMAVVLTVAAVLAALWRPVGAGTLGLGTLVLPWLLVHGAIAAAGWVAALATLATELLDRPLWLAAGGVERRGYRRRVAAAALAGAATVLAGFTWRWVARGQLAGVATTGTPAAAVEIALPIAAAAAAAAVYLAAAAALLVAIAALNRNPSPGIRLVAPLGLDAAGWVLGVPLAAVAMTLGWGHASLLGAGVIGLCLAAARGEFVRSALTRRVSQMIEAQEAGERLLAGGASGVAALVDRLRQECRVAMPAQWFELELLAGAGAAGDEGAGDGPGAPRIWSARAQHPLAPGRAEPPPSPPPLPGVHRRASWRIFRRELNGETAPLARLALWCDPRQLDPRAAELLDGLVPQLAASLERSLLERAANTDALTGLASRRAFDERLAATFRVAGDEGTPLAVVVADLDHFKQVNDTHGHAGGDAALLAVARALRQTAGSAMVARYGGEELVVLLAGADGVAALELAEQLREAVAGLTIELTSGATLSLTISLGTAAVPEVWVRSAEELVALADAALYEAKRRGRNRVFLARGQGRFEAPDGTIEHGPGGSPTSRPPQIFARA